MAEGAKNSCCSCDYLITIEFNANKRLFARSVNGVDRMKMYVAENTKWNESESADKHCTIKVYRINYDELPEHGFHCLELLDLNNL